VEDRILGLEDKIDIKEKTEELLDKRLKSCERNKQELCHSIKRPNV
jgi:tRNA splicing ligase